MNSKGNTIIHSTLEEGYDFFITDRWRKKYHFKISTFSVPTGLVSEAREVIEEKAEYESRIFHVLSDFDSDIEKSELLLKSKIKKGINQRYLTIRNGRLEIGKKLQLRGSIEWNDNLSDTKFSNILVVDGKRITFEKFSEMLQCVEGWNFKFKIYDISDDID